MPRTPEEIAAFARLLSGPVKQVHAGIVARDAAMERVMAVIADPATTDKVRERATRDLGILRIVSDIEWSSEKMQRRLNEMYPAPTEGE